LVDLRELESGTRQCPVNCCESGGDVRHSTRTLESINRFSTGFIFRTKNFSKKSPSVLELENNRLAGKRQIASQAMNSQGLASSAWLGNGGFE
jgi:hypothetical protein